ncbi:glutamate-1-semialdehyde 2,1-aminomutase [Simkania sp.]|uniref:glutamate-1-semialdehyde 2,1-aminomutase n=1 Tax=Simkania sp. TaxID=34094 RepID=UPI003B52F724
MSLSQATKSQEIFEKSAEVIAGGVNSPVRAFIGLGVDPMIVEKGEGDTIWDIEGKSYIDYCMSWGAMLLGHAPPSVVAQAKSCMEDGSSFGIATRIEEQLARKVTEIVPSIEKLRFVSSGTEAAMTAIRVARGYTGRPYIIKFNGNYHGHADPFLIRAGSAVSQISHESSSQGVPNDIVKHTISLPYNDVEKIQELFLDPEYANQIAAVVVEPVAANMGVVPSIEEFVRTLRAETARAGTVLIFDEVISGFRVGLEGAQGYYGIEPDMTCLGKIIGGGFPAAAFGGKKEIMDSLAPTGGVFQAGTLSGNPVAMAAGLETLDLAQQEGFYEMIADKTKLITEPVQMALKDRNLDACLQETVGMFTLFWGPTSVKKFEDLKALDHERFKTFFRYLLQEGVYFSPSPYEACFISAAHSEDHLIKTRDLIIDFIRQV